MDCYNGSLPEIPTIGTHGKEIYFIDIMNNLSNQFMQRVLLMSAILFIYVLYNFYIISPVMIKQYTKGSAQYWIYEVSQTFALICALTLLVFAIIDFYQWRI